MERIVALQKQLPKRKKPVTQAQSRVLQETQREANEDPFGNEDEEETPAATNLKGSVSSPTRSSFANTSSTAAELAPTTKQGKKSKPDKSAKKHKRRIFNLEKEKPQLLQTIASSSIASTNLMNDLKLLNREHIRVSENAETVNRFETCKALRRQILRYIQHVESEQWLGSLINANDGLVEALMAFEILDKSVDDDSDSDGDDWSNNEAPPTKPARHEPTKQKSGEEAFAGLTLGKAPAKPHPTMLLSSQGGVEQGEDEDEQEEEEEEEEEDGDDPFADSNAVHTPKGERPGMTWYNISSIIVGTASDVKVGGKYSSITSCSSA
ncbi:LAS seventeen-binding protein 5, partial [Lecanoromycetidae sp. Uapishka_2]